MTTDTRPWLKHYPEGVPANIDPNEYPTLVDYIKTKCNEFKKRPAFSCMGKVITYGEVDKLSDQFGAYLLSRGLEPGDRVAIMMPNLLQYPIALFGCLKAGMIIVNTNPLYTPREMEHQFNDSGASAIVVLANMASKVEEVLPKTKIKHVIVTQMGDLHDSIYRRR